MDFTWSCITDCVQNAKSLTIFEDSVVQGQGRGFVNWSSRTRTFLDNKNTYTNRHTDRQAITLPMQLLFSTSQGSAATAYRWGGKIYKLTVSCFLRILRSPPTIGWFLRRNYLKNKGGVFSRHSVHTGRSTYNGWTSIYPVKNNGRARRPQGCSDTDCAFRSRAALYEWWLMTGKVQHVANVSVNGHACMQRHTVTRSSRSVRTYSRRRSRHDQVETRQVAFK